MTSILKNAAVVPAAVVLTLCTASQAVVISQSGMSPISASEVTHAQLLEVLKNMPADAVSDQQIRVIDIGKYNVAVGVLHRPAKARQTAIAHSQVTEIYHIIEGSGTFVTGGTIENAAQADPQGATVKILVGPSTNGTAIQNGHSRKVGPGDVIVIPPGVAHWFSSVESDMNYLVLRVDADHVLPAGYVNPTLKK